MTTIALSDDFIAQTLRPYSVGTTPQLSESIRTYIDLLLRWNRKIALTTITDPAEILRLHFGESMFAVSQVPIRHGRLADVGTGAGFPAVPIGMVVPDLECILIESNQKKATFLAEVVRTLKLDHVKVYRDRMESYPVSSLSLDFSISRALGIHENFLSWSAARLNPSGRVILWLGDDDASKIIANSSWSWSPPMKIPYSQRRVVLMGSRRA
ncbi:MAG TPA: 16S rRNA (guanine(527)-N(7))-methyltransferase RsmG [Candidatus Acidoferrales bacterium]